VIPEGFVAQTDNYKTMSQDDLRKIFQGWLQAVDWSKDAANWATYKTILNEKTFPNDADFSDDVLKEMIGSVRIHDKTQALERNKSGGGLQQYLGDLKTFLKNANKLKVDYDPAVLADTSVYQSVLQ
jgi:hypothetical protein